MHKRNQAVRLPKEFEFDVREISMWKEGNHVILSSRPMDWYSYLAEPAVTSESFMDNVEDLPQQES